MADGAQPISVTPSDGATPVTEFETAADGTVLIPGLFVSDSSNDPVAVTQRCYVLQEVKAPVGYTLPTGNAAYTALVVNKGANATSVRDVTIENTKRNGPDLPLTGSAGAVLLTLLGLALLGGGLAVVMVKRSRAR